MKLNGQTPSLLEWIQSHSDDFYEDDPCGFLFTLPDGTIVKLNRTLAQWVEYTKVELLGQKRFQDLLTVGCKIYYETHYAPLIRMQGHLNELTLDFRGKSGKLTPVLINSTEIKDEMGEVLLIRSTIFNISERRSYERELLTARNRAEQAERRLSFLASAGEVLRRSQDILPNFAALAGLSTDRFADVCAFDLINDGSPNRVAEAHRFTGKTIPPVTRETGLQIGERSLLISDFHQAIDNNEIKGLRHLSSAAFEVQSLLTVPILQDRTVVGRIWFYMLELGRKFTQEDFDLALDLANRCAEALKSSALHAQSESAAIALRESHEWFSTTLRSIGDAVITVNTDHTISFMNQVAEILTGWSSAEAIGKPMEEVFVIVHELTGEPAFNPVERVLKEGVVVGLENHTVLIKKDGSRCIIEDSAAPIKRSDGEMNGVVLVFRDVTNKHAQEQERMKNLAALREEREVREKFVATLSHDLRSPITAVKMSAQLILRKLDQPEATQAQTVRIINSVNRADQMIQDLLDANRIRAGETIPLKMAPCELVAEIRDAIADLTTIHGERFQYTGANEIHGTWNCGSLRRVMENLGNNAIKYGDSQAPITIRLIQEEHRVLLSVHNMGNPIPSEDQATLFEPYRRTSAAQTGEQKGWGLGLTLVRGVAEAHGGQVAVESSAEHGTTFYFSLPLR